MASFNSESASALVSELRGTFASGKTRSYEWRSTQLKMLLRLVDDRELAIVNALHADLSKPETEAFASEISMTKASCKHALKELKHWIKPEKAQTPFSTYPSSAEIVSEPLGVVLVISAWNYPILLSLDPVIGAIAAGNSVVLKPSEISPATSSILAKFLPEYLNSSAIRVVEGAVAETTALLEQRWDKIFYTGNGIVGRVVMAAAAKHLTPVVLELGGKSPLVVDANVNLEIDALKCTLENFFGTNPMESNDLARIVNPRHFSRLAKLLDDDKVSGKIVHGGQRDEHRLTIAPTILLDVPHDSLIMNEEIFGPLLPILTVGKVEESIDLINSRSKPLAAYLFTKDKSLEKAFVRNVSSGGMLINDTILHLTVSSLPFGGVGESGMGSYHGKFSFDAFSHKKAVLYRSFDGDSSVRYPPYTPKKQRLLRALLNGEVLGLLLALIGWPWRRTN